MEKKGENRIYSIKQRKLDQNCSQMNATSIIRMQRLFEDYRKIFTILGPIHLWDDTKGAFYLSELAGRTIARPVFLTMKLAFPSFFAEKPSPSRHYNLGFG